MPDIITINLIQRITGITAFVLITLQILLSSSRKLTKIHMLNGILAYTFIFIHPILMILYRYSYMGKFDPFYVYTDFCILCDGLYEHFVNLGRIALLITTITVLTARFRNYLRGWLKDNWRKLHLANYVAFYLVSVHAYNLGSDTSKQWFIYLFWFCQIVVLVVILKKLGEKFAPKPKI